MPQPRRLKMDRLLRQFQSPSFRCVTSGTNGGGVVALFGVWGRCEGDGSRRGNRLFRMQFR